MGSLAAPSLGTQGACSRLGARPRPGAWPAGLVLATLAGAVWAGSVSYTYDTLGRLTKATFGNGVALSYAYDGAGNRSTALVSGAPAAAAVLSAPAPTTSAARTATPAATVVASTASPQEEAAAGGPVLLPAAGEDPDIYGWNDSSDRPARSVAAVFNGDGSDRLLHMQGYAIATADEVGLWLNGHLLGYLTQASDGPWSAPSLWLLPAALQMSGENVIEWVPQTKGLAWGVTRLGLYGFGSTWGNLDRVSGGDRGHPEGIELHLPTQGPGQGTGYLIELAAWDADNDAEIVIDLNGAPLVDLPQSSNGAWGSTHHLWLGTELQATRNNILMIGNRFGPLEPWGVRIERILPDDTALGDGLPDQAGAEQRPTGVRLLLPATKAFATLELRFFDVDYRNELVIGIGEVVLDHAALTGSQTWGTPQPINVPLGYPAVLSIDHTGSAPSGDGWGVRIEGWR